jgi:fatty acid CoA ligase FadD9
MLFQSYCSAVDRRGRQGIDRAAAEAQAAAELREQLLGGRVISVAVSSAPLSGEMASFLTSCLDVSVCEGYGATEVGAITRDGTVMRSVVIDYKLIDVPELGYFTSDQPHPRGELLVRSATATPGYYKRPQDTDEVFDTDGYYHTGDVVAEFGADQLACIDRRKNVVKLAHGEFVALANLETVLAHAPLVGQIFMYGNSERHYLLAVIVPTAAALDTFGSDSRALKAALSESLQQTGTFAELQSYEVPADFLIESEPFSAGNGLLSTVGKLLRPKLIDRYGERLEQLYADLAATQEDQLRELRHRAADQPVADTVSAAAAALLGFARQNIDGATSFVDLGGDSLSALTFSNLLQDIFGVEVPVGVIIAPASNLGQIAQYIDAGRRSGPQIPTPLTVHGRGATELKAADLTLDKFIDAAARARATTLPRAAGDPRTVLLTGANGYLGRFLCLDWLQRLSETGGRLICLVRGSDAPAARERLWLAFDSGDPRLLRHFRELSAGRLEVLAGDVDKPDLGLDDPTWNRLANTVDCIVHPAALVNHVLPYEHLFGPNVVGTAELIRLAITTRIKPITYISTIGVAMSVDPDDFAEDADLRVVTGVRPIDNTYASGYCNSKWAGEVLLREAHDLCALPVAVFRSGMILAHTRYLGQLNLSDAFTRLIVSLLVTGMAPKSFYKTDDHGDRVRPHYDGLPVDFVAASIVTLGAQLVEGFHSFDVVDPHDDGVSLDTFIDWLTDEGRKVQRVDNYTDWLTRFETALQALPLKQRQHTVLPLLDAYRRPQQPISGSVVPSRVFHAAVRSAEVGSDKDIPHLQQKLLRKYVTDLQHLGLLSN